VKNFQDVPPPGNIANHANFFCFVPEVKILAIIGEREFLEFIQLKTTINFGGYWVFWV
jgi:hypothetical protein